MRMAPTISIVIPALNEEDNIGKCLACLEAQTLPSTEWEVILADNGSKDATVAVAEAFQERLPLRIVQVRGCSISELRNRGASASSGRILGFLDADCMLRPDWLASSIALSRERCIWGAHYLIPLDSTWVGRTWFKFQATEQSGPVSFLPAGCMFLMRSDFEAIGGFDATVETSEDVEICARARSKGLEVFAYPELGVYHEGTPRSLIRFYRQNRWHGKHVLRVFLANLPSVRNLPLVALTVYTFVMFWIAVAALLYALTGHFGLFLLALVLLVLPPVALGTAKALKAKSPSDAVPLSALYLVYFLSRAAALTHLPLGKR